MVERSGIMVYFDLLDALEDYSKQEIGELFLAMLEYGLTGVIPDFKDRAMRTLWKTTQQKIDRDNVHFKKKTAGRRYATYCRECDRKNIERLSREEWEETVDQMISNDNFDTQLHPQPQPHKKQLQSQLQKKRFVPPTLEQIEEYCKSRNSSVNPKAFYDYYIAGNWHDSKGHPVRNWKQKIITWEKGGNNGGNQSILENGSQHSSRFADLPDY